MATPVSESKKCKAEVSTASVISEPDLILLWGSTRAVHKLWPSLTTTDSSTVLEFRQGELRTYVVDPLALGLQQASPDQLKGADAATNADVARRVFSGEKGPHRDIVLLNAAAGIVASGQAVDVTEGLVKAATSVDQGHAEQRLARLVDVSQSAASAT